MSVPRKDMYPLSVIIGLIVVGVAVTVMETMGQHIGSVSIGNSIDR